jgi:hypothetical protein
MIPVVYYTHMPVVVSHTIHSNSHGFVSNNVSNNIFNTNTNILYNNKITCQNIFPQTISKSKEEIKPPINNTTSNNIYIEPTSYSSISIEHEPSATSFSGYSTRIDSCTDGCI